MKINFYDKVENLSPHMTKRQQTIAKYLLKNPMDVAFSTVQQLADKTGTSTATIIRFANSLGYQGFVQFQQELQDFLTIRANPLKRLEAGFFADDDRNVSLFQIYKNQLKNLESTFSKIQESDMFKTVELIGKANHVYTIGTMGSSCVAYYLAHHLNKALQRASMLTEDGLLPEQIVKVKTNDVLIIINMPRYSQQIYATAQIAKSQGATIVTITDSEFSPFSQVSDILFYASCHSQDYHNSQLAGLLVAEMIIAITIEKFFDQARSNIDKLEPIYSNLGILIGVHKNPENS